MSIYLDLPTGRGTSVRVELSKFAGKDLIGIRQYFQFHIGDPDTAQPTKRGVSLRVQHLPKLRAALEAAEADALKRGLLEPEDYLDADLAVPPQLAA